MDDNQFNKIIEELARKANKLLSDPGTIIPEHNKQRLTRQANGLCDQCGARAVIVSTEPSGEDTTRYKLACGHNILSPKRFQERVVVVDRPVKLRIESDYLVISNREKCRQLLIKTEFTENNLIDFFIALHMVLEVGLNTFFRHLYLTEIKKNIDKLEIIKNLDEISFRDKVTLFVYNSKFDFNGKMSEAENFHRIIGKIRDFSGLRNQLLHGHSLSTLYENGSSRQSTLRSAMTVAGLQRQIENFKFIMDGMRFYLDCLESSWTVAGKNNLKKEYLDISFLNNQQVEVVL